MRLKHFKIYFILFLLLSCNDQKENHSYNGVDLIKLEKEIKVDSELSLDSLINLAKEVDNELSLNCEIDSKIVTSPTTVCYLDNEIKKITETRNLSFDTTSKARIVIHRIIYLINNEYSLVLHPIFESPETILDKWNWSKVIIKNNEVIQYKAQDYKNHKEIFLSKKSSRFTNAQNYYPIKIEFLLNKYNKQSK